MRKKKFLQTDFIKFILEKYAQDEEAQGQNLPEDEEPTKIKHLKEFDEEESEEESEEPTEDDILINELLREYKRLKKKYESNKIYNRRR